MDPWPPQIGSSKSHRACAGASTPNSTKLVYLCLVDYIVSSDVTIGFNTAM